MTLNQLLYFEKITETQNMGRAAKLLHISQPSLSIALSNLEKELNVELFNRIGHRLLLSNEGEQFLVHVKKILREVRDAELHMQSLSADRNLQIRIGCLVPVLYDYLPRLIHDFLALPENHLLKIDFTTNNTSKLIPMLKEGYFDYIICSKQDDPELIQTELISEPYVLLCPPGAQVPTTWNDILAQNLIGFQQTAAAHHEIHTALVQQDIQPTYVYRAPDEESIASLVSHGLGYGIVPKVQALENFNLQIVPLPDTGIAFVRKIYLTQLINRPAIGAAKRFLNYLKTH